MAASSHGEDDDAASTKSTEKKPSRVVTVWKKLGLDFKTVAMMLKGSLAPTIAIAMYQAPAVAQHYQTVGYLVAIISLLGFPIMSRGLFLQTMSLNLIATGLGAAVNLLALYSATEARAHTTPAGGSLSDYNSSASAICAIWLIFQIYLINYLRAARPQFQFPAIIYSIFTMVSLTYGTAFPTMAAALAFLEQVLEAFVTGFALSIAVHFLVFPVSTREVVCSELSAYLMSVSGVLKAECHLMHHIEDVDPVAARHKAEKEQAKESKKKRKHQQKPADISVKDSPEGKALKAAVDTTMALHSKINADIVTAHREVSFGKISQKDLSTFWKKSHGLITPLLGLVCVLDYLKHSSDERQYSSTDLTDDDLKRNQDAIKNLHITASAMRAPLESMTKTLTSGLTHVSIQMELIKLPKQSASDPEQGNAADAPGSATFTASFRQELLKFQGSKQVQLEEWCRQKGIGDPDRFLRDMRVHSPKETEPDTIEDQFQRQLFLMLYLEYLLLRIGHKVLDLILFAEELRQAGKFKHYRMVLPGSKATYKWFKSIFGQDDLTQDENLMGSDLDPGTIQKTYLGRAFCSTKDPEHLPPQNMFESVGETIRLIPRFFSSENSSFAFRVACATMSIAIGAYLEASQQFFLQQRLLWALIMVAISMSRTVGQSTFNFVLRVLGTVVAMVGAYIVWYIVDGRAPGVIVFLWLWMFIGFYFVLKFPKFIIVGILAIVTTILIVAYELQVQILGLAVSESNGQPAYGTYLLAPYRLACVAGGLLVAYIWTIWPYPVSEHSELRKELAATLYLLANFYSNVHETVQSKVLGTAGDVSKKGSHAYILDKAKGKILTQILSVLSEVQTNAAFSKFQVVVGGRFPQEEYQAIIDCIRRILVSTALIAHASDTLGESSANNLEHSEWYQDFRKITQGIGNTSHGITSTLALLSSSLSTGQPLPPYMQGPPPFEFVAHLEAIDKTILSVQHINEPEYSAFVVIQLCAKSLHKNLAILKTHVTNLVGEMDFSFKAPKPESSVSLSSTDSKSDRIKEQ